MDLRRVSMCLRPVGLVVLTALILCGCATPALDSARSNFYAGKYDKACETLDSAKIPENNQVLFRMERGTIRLFAGHYESSAQDYIEASDQLDKLETYSLSKGAASWVANDSVQDFRGTPYERTLLHAFTAKDHLAMANWDNAAVEARRIIKSLDSSARGNYPEDAYSRYMAGFCLEMIDDDSNAAIQYRRTSAQLSGIRVDENTGHLLPAPLKPASTNSAAAPDTPSSPPKKPGPMNWSALSCWDALPDHTKPGEKIGSPTSRCMPKLSIRANFWVVAITWPTRSNWRLPPIRSRR